MQSFSPALNRDSKLPLYRQLYGYIVSELREGRIKGGERLPSKRRLAQDLGISLNTVETAYQLLLSEGYIESKERSGFFASRLTGLQPSPTTKPQLSKISRDKRRNWKYDLSVSRIDAKTFPVKTWQRLYRKTLSERTDLLNLGSKQGEPELCQAICDYLHDYRSVSCRPEQVVVGAGLEYLIGILACLIKGDTVALENPGYLKTREIFLNQGLDCRYIPVDNYGMSVEDLSRSDAKVAYITPSHQFPGGMVMPAGRRESVLQWAREVEGRYLIEDDYDSEFRFDRFPLPSLQGVDSDGKVIYLGTFSRSLAPGIRISYMVLPFRLLERFHRDFKHYNSTVSRFDQITLADFLIEGYFSRHLNRIKKSYRDRRDALLGALERSFGEWFSFEGTHTGLHFLATFNLGIGEDELVGLARKAGVNIEGYGKFFCPENSYNKNSESGTLVLGYGDLPCEKAEPAVKLLKEIWRRK